MTQCNITHSVAGACYENDRNRLREFIMSWFELNSRGQAWYSHGMSYAEMIWGHFYSLDKNGWVNFIIMLQADMIVWAIQCQYLFSFPSCVSLSWIRLQIRAQHRTPTPFRNPFKLTWRMSYNSATLNGFFPELFIEIVFFSVTSMQTVKRCWTISTSTNLKMQ